MTENLLQLLITITVIGSLWKIFQKSNHKGWHAIIPFYNLYILTKIIRKKWWWVILYIIPYIGVIFIIWSTNRLRKSFQKNWLFFIGMVALPFIFYPILGLDNSIYIPLDESEEEKEQRENAEKKTA